MTGLEQVLRDEGFRPRPYQDTRGIWTFGHGLTWITEAESRWIVERRLGEIRADLASRLVWWATLNEARAWVLIGMAFNMGIAGLTDPETGFRLMLGHCALGEWEQAAEEIRRSKADTEEHQRIERWAKQMRLGEFV